MVYSVGKCGENNKYDYAVKEEVVTAVDVSLKKSTALDKLGFDLSKVTATESSDVVGLFTYEEEGIFLSGSRTKLHGLELAPTPEQEKLSCRNVSKAAPKADESSVADPWQQR